METIRKISENEVEIVEPKKIVEEVVIATKTLEELEADYLQAFNSVKDQREAFEAKIAPEQATVDLFLARLNEAKAKGVIAKPVEEKPVEVIEKPIAELPIKPIITK